MDDLLRVRDLRVSIALPECGVPAVNGVDFRIRPGSTVALVGESGSGKSITAYAIMGLLPSQARIESGEILFADPAQAGKVADLAKLRPSGAAMRAIRGGRISMIFQEPMTSLSPLHTVGDQIGEALTCHKERSTGEADEHAQRLLALVGFQDPASAMGAYPFELSGGLRQRAMIAMALICRPALLIADEPTTALDVTIQAQILKLIADLQREFGMAVLMITHDLGVVANMAEEIVVLFRGEVVEAGASDDIFRRPQHPYLKALFDAAPRIGVGRKERLRPVHDIAARGGRSAGSGDGASAMPRQAPATVPPAADASPSNGPVLEVDGLSKTFGVARSGRSARAERVRAVDDVTLSIHRGETLGLVGESGSGKSTLAKLIMRAMPPDAGSIRYRDGPEAQAQDVLALGGDELSAYRSIVQYVFQDPYASLNPRMTIADIVTEPLIVHQIGNRKERTEAARECLRLVGLDARYLNRYPHSFSGGQRQRIGIARAIALRPKLLICDEPVSALDVGIQAQILNLLKDLQAALSLTYLFVSHNLAVVDYIADRIAVMCRGRIVELAPREELFRQPLHPYTRGLLAAAPDIDVDNRLDFGALMDERCSEPAAWPAPYCDDDALTLRMHDIGNGHFVRAAVNAARRDLVA